MSIESLKKKLNKQKLLILSGSELEEMSGTSKANEKFKKNNNNLLRILFFFLFRQNQRRKISTFRGGKKLQKNKLYLNTNMKLDEF